MKYEDARKKVERVAADMCEVIRREQGFTPDCYWIDRTKYRVQDLSGNPIATLHVETVQ